MCDDVPPASVCMSVATYRKNWRLLVTLEDSCNVFEFSKRIDDGSESFEENRAWIRKEKGRGTHGVFCHRLAPIADAKSPKAYQQRDDSTARMSRGPVHSIKLYHKYSSQPSTLPLLSSKLNVFIVSETSFVQSLLFPCTCSHSFPLSEVAIFIKAQALSHQPLSRSASRNYLPVPNNQVRRVHHSIQKYSLHTKA